MKRCLSCGVVGTLRSPSLDVFVPFDVVRWIRAVELLKANQVAVTDDQRRGGTRQSVTK